MKLEIKAVRSDEHTTTTANNCPNTSLTENERKSQYWHVLEQNTTMDTKLLNCLLISIPLNQCQILGFSRSSLNGSNPPKFLLALALGTVYTLMHSLDPTIFCQCCSWHTAEMRNRNLNLTVCKRV